MPCQCRLSAVGILIYDPILFKRLYSTIQKPEVGKILQRSNIFMNTCTQLYRLLWSWGEDPVILGNLASLIRKAWWLSGASESLYQVIHMSSALQPTASTVALRPVILNHQVTTGKYFLKGHVGWNLMWSIWKLKSLTKSIS